MRFLAPSAFLFSACFLFLTATGFSQSQPPASAAQPQKAAVGKAVSSPATAEDKYKNEALVWQQFDTTIHMHADGTGDRTVHIVVRLQSEGAARQFSVLSVPYASAYETGSIDFIRVHKPDGTTVETPVADAMEMPAAVTREAPLYSDLKEKQLPVRSLAAGDVLDYQFHTERTKAEAPGQFWGAEHFLVEGGVVLSQTLTLEVPATKYVLLWDPNHPAKPVMHDGLLTYRWTSSQLDPTPKPADPADKNPAPEKKDPDEDADGRKLPSVGWTTFHNWAEVGDWYRALAEGRSTPTPAIQARAAQLTKDAKTPEDQLRALYDYVSKTRYVGIDFGVGRYQPHTADEVMDHEYGDCKDKDTLLESLARAKGFVTAPALIGVSIAPVADLPSPASFNHVITTVLLPGSTKANQIWLDTTPEVAPYRVLVPQIRDEKALVIPDNGIAALESTPADPPYPYAEHFEATGTLDKDGLLKSHMTMTLRSDNELSFRVLLQRLAPAQWDQSMQYVSSGLGFGGTVTNSNLKQTDSSGPVRITYDYSRPAYADWEHLRILPLFPYLEVTTIDKDKAPEHDIDQGAPRTLEATTHLQLPDGYRADLPDAVHVKRDYATFDKTYRLDKNELIVERKAVILKKKVPKAEWKDYSAYMKSIGMDDGENYIRLIASGPAQKPSAPVELKVDPKTGNKTATVELAPTGAQAIPEPAASKVPTTTLSESDLPEAMKEAARLESERDWPVAKEKLGAIKQVRPDYPYLMSMLGYLAEQTGKPEEAIEDYKAELAHHPDANVQVVLLLALSYSKQKRNDEAISLLKSYSDRNDLSITNALVYYQQSSGDDTGALATLQTATVAHPENRRLHTQTATCLNRLHRSAEAATAAEAAMDGSDDPGILNDAAYELSLTKIDLPVAEKNARRAVDLLESGSTQISLQEVNTKAFQQTNLLIASWDTLGWILFLESKPADAEPYIAAAWFNQANLVVGDHLAQIKEALGKPDEALTLDDLAAATTINASDKDAKAEIHASKERLTKKGARSSAGNPGQKLQDMRTFHIDRPKDLKGAGTFRVQLGGTGITDCDLVQGDESVRPLCSVLKQIRIPGVVPPGSQARLVRDAVLSCSTLFKTCDLVLTPDSGLQVEGLR